VATGQKRFQEWKLRRRGSTTSRSLDRQFSAPLTTTATCASSPFNLPSRRCGSVLCGEEDKEGDEDALQTLRAQYAAIDLSSDDSAACAVHHVEPSSEGLDIPEQDQQTRFASADISPVDIHKQFKDMSKPVKWTLNFPVWPITVELAVDIKRTISDPSQAPCRIPDPEDPPLQTQPTTAGDIEAPAQQQAETPPMPHECSLGANAARLSHWKTC